MTRTLFVTPRPPLPATQGAPMRNLSMLGAAARRGPVDLVTFRSPLDQGSAETDLRNICERVALVPPIQRTVRDRARSLVQSSLPDMAHRLWSGEMLKTLECWTRTSSYDVVQIEGIEMARMVLESRPNARLVFDDHNVEYLLQQRAHEVDRHRPTRLHMAAYSALQAARLRRFESTVCRAADATIAVSEEDATRLAVLSGVQPVTIPNAIDPSDYPQRTNVVDRAPVLLFPGTMDFRPNADAAIWFIEQVLPRLARQAPDIQCFFAGRNPKPALVRHGQLNAAVAVTGEVPSMAPYWARASICILPLQVGGGSRFKALEAMALGIPIVSTSLGMEGIAAVPGRDYLRADEPSAFAEAVTNVLRDLSLQSSLASCARRVVERGYTHAIVSERLNQLYDRLGV